MTGETSRKHRIIKGFSGWAWERTRTIIKYIEKKATRNRSLFFFYAKSGTNLQRRRSENRANPRKHGTFKKERSRSARPGSFSSEPMRTAFRLMLNYSRRRHGCLYLKRANAALETCENNAQPLKTRIIGADHEGVSVTKRYFLRDEVRKYWKKTRKTTVEQSDIFYKTRPICPIALFSTVCGLDKPSADVFSIGHNKEL